MKPIKNMFNEVQYELVKIILLNVFLSTVILFLAADLVALVFNMPIWYVIVISFLYFVILMYHEVKKISITEVEKNNPNLHEILRTAKDNQNEDSLMAHALFFEVIEKMRKVSSGTFLDLKKILTKLGAIFALAIILISLTYFNVNIARFENPLEGPLSGLGAFLSGMTGEGDPNAGGNIATDGDIFGDPSMAKLGDDQLIATVNPSLDSPDFNNVDPSSPNSDPLADLSGDADAEFNTGGAFSQEGLDARDLQRSYEYAKRTTS